MPFDPTGDLASNAAATQAPDYPASDMPGNPGTAENTGGRAVVLVLCTGSGQHHAGLPDCDRPEPGQAGHPVTVPGVPARQLRWLVAAVASSGYWEEDIHRAPGTGAHRT